jgi:catechol 2,3-dioxygenase-like lactoylglutathione lyase family enzyme
MARIRHLAIVTENRERLVKFYTTAFGMKVVDGVGPAIYLSDGYLNVAIIQKRPHYKEGLYHFGFEVENIEALKPVCKELGAASEVQKRPPNREAEYRVHDPDGNPIDLSQRGWPVYIVYYSKIGSDHMAVVTGRRTAAVVRQPSWPLEVFESDFDGT